MTVLLLEISRNVSENVGCHSMEICPEKSTRSSSNVHQSNMLGVIQQRFMLLTSSIFLFRTRLMFYRFIVTSSQNSLIFSSCYKQAILERMHITPSGIEDFTSHWQSVHNFSAFPFNSAGERPRGAGSFIVWKKRDAPNASCSVGTAAILGGSPTYLVLKPGYYPSEITPL